MWKRANATNNFNDMYNLTAPIENGTDATLTYLTVSDKVNLSSTGDINATKFYGNFTGEI